MKLRIARKLDPLRNPSRPGRPWWTPHTPDQLDRAARRLHRSWARLCPWQVDENGKRFRKVSPDWFAGNRAHARRVTQVARNRHVRERGTRP